MFNVSQFFKKLTEAKEKHDKAVKEAKLQTLYLKKRDQFSDNYKKRVNQFIVEMSYEPIVVKQHIKPLNCSERIQDPKKFKGGHIMIMKGYRSEKERIKETLAQNSFLDNEGANFTKLNLRARDQSKEINPGMRFKAQSAIERVIDAGQKKNKIDYTPQNMSAKDKINQLLPRDIFDQLHKKTHFKAVQSLSLGGLHNSLRSSLNGSPSNVFPNKPNFSNSQQAAKSSNIQNEKPQNQIETQQTNARTKIDMTVPLTQDEIVKHARQVLQDCNVQPIGKSPILSKGRGRLMSNSLHTNKEAYQMTSAFKSAQQSKDNSIL